MAEVRLENIKKTYDNGVTVVHGINLTVKDKEFMVLVGPSGCGKSTTLRMIAGLEDITEGKLYIGDKIVNDIPPKDRDIAMVFQNYALYPHMNVYDNMAFGLKLRKYSKKEIDDRVQEAAEILEIKHLLDRKPKALSGGQRQRVAVGRAIVRKPQVFLFDEPLSNLDAKLRVQMRTEINKLHKRLAVTMIYVTHDQVEAMTMGERITVMKDGRIHQIDGPLTLYDNPVDKFVAGFIGSPPMNFIQGRLIKEGDDIFFIDEKIKIKVPARMHSAISNYINKEVIFGIRPEHIYDSNFASVAAEPAEIKVKVDLVEPMGNEIFVYLSYISTGKNSIVARINSRKEPSIGDDKSMTLDMSRAHFFDIETEKCII